MKDLIKIIDKCKLQLDSIGIKYGNVRNVTVNTRAKCRWGECKKIASSVFDINISNVLLDDDVDEQILMNTVMHELLHTVPGCLKHTGKWKTLADFVNKQLPFYNIKRTMSYDEAGISHNLKEPVYRYFLQCENCGIVIKRQRKSRVISEYKKYRCSKCGGKLKLI